MRVTDPAGNSLTPELTASESWAWVDDLVLTAPGLEDLQRLTTRDTLEGINSLSLSDAGLELEALPALTAATPVSPDRRCIDASIWVRSTSWTEL